MEERAPAKSKMKPSKTAVLIVEDASTPVMARRKGDCYIADIKMIPLAKFMDSVKPKVMDQIADSSWHYNRLSRSYSAQSTPVQMIKVSVSDQYQIDGRQMINPNSRPTNSLHHLEPERPDRVHQDVETSPANQEGSVSDPGETKIFSGQIRKQRPRRSSLATCEKGRNVNLREKIPSQPSLPGSKANAVPILPQLIQHNTPLEFLSQNGKSGFDRNRIWRVNSPGRASRNEEFA
jgi:hypothetical protein